MSMRSIFLFCSENGSEASFSRKSLNSDPWMAMCVTPPFVPTGPVVRLSAANARRRAPSRPRVSARIRNQSGRSRMSFFERAKAAATDLASKADVAMQQAGINTPGGGGGERTLRDLGVLAYLEA